MFTLHYKNPRAPFNDERYDAATLVAIFDEVTSLELTNMRPLDGFIAYPSVHTMTYADLTPGYPTGPRHQWAGKLGVLIDDAYDDDETERLVWRFAQHRQSLLEEAAYGRAMRAANE